MRSMPHALLPERTLKRVRAIFALRPMRVAGPVGPEALDNDYTTGRWDYLEGPSELARFAVVAGYVSHFSPGGAILDVGSGAGRLRSFFDASKFDSYLGLDYSSEAVRRASSRGFERTRFEFADMNAGPPPGRFDAIVFSECLYYAANPRQLFETYWAALNPEGLCVVSMFKGVARSTLVWREVLSVRRPVYATRLTNEREMTWDVRVFRKL